jgi:hypothetical protein
VRTQPTDTLGNALQQYLRNLNMTRATVEVLRADSGYALRWDEPCASVDKADVVLQAVRNVLLRFPDGTTSRLPLNRDWSLRQVLEPAYLRRGLTFDANPPMMRKGKGPPQNVNLDGPCTQFAEMEIQIVARSTSPMAFQPVSPTDTAGSPLRISPASSGDEVSFV